MNNDLKSTFQRKDDYHGYLEFAFIGEKEFIVISLLEVCKISALFFTFLV